MSTAGASTTGVSSADTPPAARTTGFSTAGASPADMPLTARVSGFIVHLRHNGIEVGPSDTDAALRVLARGPAPTLAEARRHLKILLTGRRGEWERFDDLFEAYWLAQGRVRVRPRPAHARHAGRPSRATLNLWGERAGEITANRTLHSEAAGAEPGGEGKAGEAVQASRAASARHALGRTDLRHAADTEEMASAAKIAYRLARALRYRLSRRYRAASRGARIDIRRTIRRNLTHGGEPLTLVRRRRPERPVRIVLMLDVSGSMQPYARCLLQFVRGLVESWDRADAYLFHTRLVRITGVLREKDALLAMSRLSLMAEGFGGGTRMSACLGAFNDHYAKRTLDSRSVFMMISDGYDTGEPDACVEQMVRLRRRARRVVWLNPMLGWTGYEPLTRTMRAVLPYVDHFAPAHSLDALAALETELETL